MIDTFHTRHTHIIKRLIGTELVEMEAENGMRLYTFAEMNSLGDGVSHSRMYASERCAWRDLRRYDLVPICQFGRMVVAPRKLSIEENTLWQDVKLWIRVKLGFSPVRPALPLLKA